MSPEQRNDVDCLFDRLEPLDPPADFVATVMAQTRQVQARQSRGWVIWAALDLLAALLLTSTAFMLGRMLTLGSWTAGHLLLDLDLALASPGEWLLAVSEITPLVAIMLLVAAGLVVAWCTRALLRDAPSHEARTA